MFEASIERTARGPRSPARRRLTNDDATDVAELSTVVSVHDVMEKNLPDILQILSVLEELKVCPVTLLVVPGSGWCTRAVKTLMALERAGYVLAGHGWTHAAMERRTLIHKLHGAMFSRHTAEHLSRDARSVRDIIARCYEWFADAGLKPPRLYVPPAWAMGSIDRAALHELRFSQYEYLTGLYDISTKQFYRLPLVGYEADQHKRVWPLRTWNTVNIARAKRYASAPLRIAIHPNDLRLPLAADLKHLLGRCRRFHTYDEVPALATVLDASGRAS